MCVSVCGRHSCIQGCVCAHAGARECVCENVFMHAHDNVCVPVGLSGTESALWSSLSVIIMPRLCHNAVITCY